MTRAKVRVDGRGVSRPVEDVCGRIVGVKQAAPNRDVDASDPGPNPTPEVEVRAMKKRIKPPQTEHQRLTLEYLERARQDLEQAARSRIRYAQLGKKYGLTNQEIADALGVTEAAVRSLMQRHAGPVIS